MVHWVFSTFGKQPVVSRSNSRKRRSTPLPSPVTVEASHQVFCQETQHDEDAQSPTRESKRDSDFNSQRASAGSSTLNTRQSRAQTAESSHSTSHNLRGLGDVAAPAPATFYAKEALEIPHRSASLDIGANEEPRPIWPLPDSMLSGSTKPSDALGSVATVGQSVAGRRRSLSNSSKRRIRSVRMSSSQELGRPNSDQLKPSYEHPRTQSRISALPVSLEDVDEVGAPLPADPPPSDSMIVHQTSGQTLIAAHPEGCDVQPAQGMPEANIQQRTSSMKAPTITAEGSNLRDVDPDKLKGKSKSHAESNKVLEARKSQRSFLSPRSSSIRPPGSRSRDSDLTALPRFLYNQSNLEEQLEAARMMQSSTPPLSIASGTSTVASRLASELYTLSYLIFFSILGTLARIGLQALTFYPGSPAAISLLWSNFAGSFVLGFLAEDRRIFREEWASHKPQTPSFAATNRDVTSLMSEKSDLQNRRGHRDDDQPSQIFSHGRVKKTIPLYIGLASGFCGSTTSFSGFMRDAFLALSNKLPTPVSHTYPDGFILPAPTDSITRNAGYSVMAVLAVVLLTICLSIGGLRFGAHLAILLDPVLPTLRFTTMRRFIDPLFVFLGWGVWVAAIVMCIWPPDRPGGPQSIDDSWASETWRSQALFACAFAPLGCLLRFYTSIFLNSLSASFPLGTFAVNVFGTAVEGMAFDLQHIRIGALVGGGRLPCQALQGVQDGFCGALTTVSTWAAELNGLRRHHAYVYGLSSIVCALSLMIAIMGSVLWSVGWSEPVCSV